MGAQQTTMAAKTLVDGKIAGKKVMVFSKSTCPYCAKAKEEFQRLIDGGTLSETDYEVLEMDGRSDCSELQAYLKSVTGASSVPRVFINGECIGGGDETVNAARTGQLAEMVK